MVGRAERGNKKAFNELTLNACIYLVEVSGIEPLTS